METAGDSPGSRGDGRFSYDAFVYDAAADRIVFYGGDENRDLYSLALDVAPAVWTKLASSGAAPGFMHHQSAVYDPATRRMIVVGTKPQGVEVFALELAANPVWHRFCVGNITPQARRWTNPVLTPVGMFVSGGSGAFLFDPNTPYCD
jgi:hypothetical protein